MMTPRERFEELLPDYAEGIALPAEVSELEVLLGANPGWRADVEAERELLAGLRALPRRDAPKGLLAESIVRARAAEAAELGEDIAEVAVSAPRAGLFLRLGIAAAALFGIVWLGADVLQQSPSRTEEKAAPEMALKSQAMAESDARVSSIMTNSLATTDTAPEASGLAEVSSQADFKEAVGSSGDQLVTSSAAPLAESPPAPPVASPAVRDQALAKRRDWGDSQFAQMRQNELHMRLPAERESQDAPMLMGKLEMAVSAEEAPSMASALDSEGQLIAAIQGQNGRFLRIGNAAAMAAEKDKAAGSRALRMRSDEADAAPAGRVAEFSFATRGEAGASLARLRADVHTPWVAWLPGATITDRGSDTLLTIPLPTAP